MLVLRACVKAVDALCIAKVPISLVSGAPHLSTVCGRAKFRKDAAVVGGAEEASSEPACALGSRTGGLEVYMCGSDRDVDRQNGAHHSRPLQVRRSDESSS